MKSRLLAILFLSFAAAALSLRADDTTVPSQGSLVHTVFFWLRDGVTEAEEVTFHGELKKLLKIEEILHGWIGVPAATEARGVVDGSYDYSITFVFESVAAEQKYQIHPVHKEFVKTNSPLWEKVVVYDAITPLP